MKNLTEWRACIDKYLNSKRALIENKRVLDIGVGDSTNTVRAINPDLYILDLNRREGDVNVIYGDITKPDTLPNESFDTVICCEVLEHVANPFEAAEGLLKLTRLGSDIIITVPCFLPWHPGEPHYPDHWRFMPSSIKALFKGFKVTEKVFDSNIQGMPLGICAVVEV